ncbi:MAG: 50S ribosomal protein L32e [Candidatus Thermoplasmatota archaeon]|nr:50S ribosomal protein L32e [Candidatus Thermoplasmatota archaeon]
MAKEEVKKPQTKKKTIDKPKEKTQTKKTTVKKQTVNKTIAQKKAIEKPSKETKKEETVKKETKKPEIKEKIEEKKVIKLKKKPVLNEELKQQLEKRKEIQKRTPEFLREEWFRYKRIPKNWRRPDGITSKMRKNLAYRPSKVRVGFRGPKQTRGLHSSGFEDVTIFNVKDLEALNPKTQAARIGGSVGTKKRIDIGKKAEELDIRILNL